MKAFWSISFSLGALLGSTTLQAASLDEELESLLEMHPQVKSAEQAALSAQASVREAEAGYLPTIDFSGSTGFEQDDKTRYDPASGGKTRLATDSIALTFTQNLFNGFRDKAGIASAEIGRQLADVTVELTKQQILNEAVNAYIEVLRQRTLILLSKDNQETLRSQLHLEDERVQRGSGVAVDVLQAKSRLQIAKERTTAFEGALQDSISRYVQVFDLDPDVNAMSIISLPLDKIPESVDAAVEIAVAYNPQLQASKIGIDIAEKAIKTAEGGYYPTIDLVGTSSYDDNISATLGEETKYSVKLQANWQVFSGFADDARNSRAEHDYQAAKENYLQARRKVVEEVRLAWSSLETSRKRAELLENAVNIASEVYAARKKLRDAGSETALNVLDAENELYRARIDAASAKFDYYLAIYRLLAAMGVLTLENV